MKAKIWICINSAAIAVNIMLSAQGKGNVLSTIALVFLSIGLALAFMDKEKDNG